MPPIRIRSDRRRFLTLIGLSLAEAGCAPFTNKGGRSTGFATNAEMSAEPAEVGQPFSPMKPGVIPGNLEKSLRESLKGRTWRVDERVELTIPKIAENGAIVPVTVESQIKGTRRVLIFSENNPRPLLAEFWFEPGVETWVSLRLKLNTDGRVLAIAEADAGYFGTTSLVKVMKSGCG